MTNYSITLPLPPRTLGPNARGIGRHWATKARAIKSYRATCGLIIKHFWKQREVIAGLVTIDLDFYLCKGWHVEDRYFPRDAFNAASSAKAALDALADAGVIKGDTKKYVRVGEVRLHSKKPEHQNRTELVMTLNLV